MENCINFESREEEIVPSFESSVRAVSGLFRKYSVEDVAESIFVSSIWLPNISSPVKHQFITAVFASLKPEEYSLINQIESYGDFREFLEKAYELTPRFLLLEDYVPEPDWGQVRFHHDGRNYKMFYGNELSNIYEYLTLFQITHLPFEKDYVKLANRSPSEELECCLRLQEEIINGISAQPDKESITDISPGHLEVPPEEFWEDARSFYSRLRPEKLLPDQLLKAYSLQLGTLPPQLLARESFGDSVFRGTLLPVFFIEHKSRYFCILPRRYPSILFDAWSEIFGKNRERIDVPRERLRMSLTAQVHRFVEKRLKTNHVYPMVSAVTKDGRAHGITFATAFISKDKLILLYLAQPGLSGRETHKELNDKTAELNEAIALISHQPTTLALRMEGNNIEFHPPTDGDILKPEVMVLIPQISTQSESFSIPKSLPGKVIWLDSFLGIVDELEDDEDFADFIKYLGDIGGRTHSALSMLDKFASFKDSDGVLVGGALEYDLIVLDPHWGTHRRYESLSEFWNVYPEADFFDHPRTWKVIQETDTRVRLEARGYPGTALHCKTGSTNIYMTAPFAEMSFEQGRLSNLLMECLEDSISRRKPLFQEHNFFTNINRLQINLFPLSLVTGNAKLQHLQHLCNITKYWCSDYGLRAPGKYAIRIVFDDNKITKAFEETQDSSVEVAILLEVLRHMDRIVPDPGIEQIIEALQRTKTNRPRFKLFREEKPASFPEFVDPCEPKAAHFRRAKKRIAELARKLDISEGHYELEAAKEKLNLLKGSIVSEVNSVIARYDFEGVIPFLISKIDALNARYEHKRMGVEHSVRHDTDYEAKEMYAEEHGRHITMHKNYRYLIEKFVQIEPHGQKKFGVDEFQYLIALIDWLHAFYSASDNLHYGILPVGMKLDGDYSVEIKYEEGMESREREFSEELAQLELGLIGKPEDRVSSPRAVEEFLEELDQAFIKDLGFSFRFMVNVLHVLTHWPVSRQNVEESPSYSAQMTEIEDACIKIIQGIQREEIRHIIGFLTLKKDDVIRVLGQTDPCLDLPVWEHRKRYSRYTLRPIIKIGDKYHWGPYSARGSGLIWSGRPLAGALPTDLEAPTIDEVLGAEKKLIEDALNEKGLEIVKRFTLHARKNLKLHKLEPKWSHPSDLGDYDIIAFYPEKNVIFNIECKDILPVHCLKDAKALRETIFGHPGKDKGHFTQIDKREEYLSAHLPDIVKALDWPVDPNQLPEIITIYLSRRSYWWTHFPPYDVTAKFLRIDLLSDFIEHINQI